MADDDGLNFDFEEQLDVQPEQPAEKVGGHSKMLTLIERIFVLQSVFHGCSSI